MVFGEINYLAVLVGAIASMVIGSLWYSPLLFGNLWMRAGGISKDAMDKAKQSGMAWRYLLAFIGSLLIAGVLAIFVQGVGVSFVEGMKIGFWIWLGFIVPLLLGNVLWEGKNWTVFLINAAYQLLILIVIGGIVAIWR